MSTYERVTTIAAQRLGVDKDKLTPETNWQNDLGCDSLDMVELVMEFEEEFDIHIPDDAIEGVATVGQCVAGIDKIRSE